MQVKKHELWREPGVQVSVGMYW